MTSLSSTAHRAELTLVERLKSLTGCSFRLMRSDVSVFESNLLPRADAIPPSSGQLTVKLIWLGCIFTT